MDPQRPQKKTDDTWNEQSGRTNLPHQQAAKPAPLPFRARLAMLAGKGTAFFLRLLRRSGTALPGKVALRIDPELLSRLTAGQSVILVTGTNGKTTTVRLLSAILRAFGYPVITNPSGANLDSGLTSMLISGSRLLLQARGSSLPPALVFEIDEAFFGKLAGKLHPRVCVVTNFFRDQLDRFGELQHTRDLIAKGLAECRPISVLCADDSLCASLAVDLPADSVRTYGADRENLQPQSADSVLEAPFCLYCGTRYEYAGISYGHLGDFHCPGCGFRRPEPDLRFRANPGARSVGLRFYWNQEDASVDLPIAGLHNGYNAAAAVSAALAAGLPLDRSVAALADVTAAFGRMERFQAGDRQVCLILVKNPVGMDQALEFVMRAEDRDGLIFLLNSNDPDGRDVSWIWDVRFENRLPEGRIGVSGERANDLALRLVYAGKADAELDLDLDALRLFDRRLAVCRPGGCLYILPNYTSMLALRAALARRYNLPDFWR